MWIRDYKPELAKRDGQALEGFDRFTGFFANAVGGLMKSPFEFKPHGQSSKHVSSIFPNLSKHVDKMAFIHSGHTESNNLFRWRLAAAGVYGLLPNMDIRNRLAHGDAP